MTKIKNVFKLNENSMFDAPQKALPAEIAKKLQSAYTAIQALSDISNYFSQNNAMSMRRGEAERVMAEIDVIKQEFDRTYEWLKQTMDRTV